MISKAPLDVTPTAELKSVLSTESTDLNPLNAIRVLRSAGGTLFTQATLHAELVQVEWAEEKSRLLKMHMATLLGFACLLCIMLMFSVLVLSLIWETAYRIPSIIGLIIVYGFGIAIAWSRFQMLSALGGQSFAATREELSADIALLKSRI